MLIILIGILVGPYLYTERKYDRSIRLQVVSSLNNVNISRKQTSEQAGYVIVKGVNRYLTEDDLYHIFDREKIIERDHVFYLGYQGVSNATASAQGLDRLHHFVNSYLVGFMPFETDAVWVPLYTLTLQKSYMFDHLQYSGLADVWQNSRQAFYYTRGDCEDHAIILADWLIGLGRDARVVLGTVNGEGHAWVVLFMDEKEYLLEATDKRKLRSVNDFQLAYLATEYRPEYQFNRHQFWFNTGSAMTTKYSGDHWVLKSEFVSAKNKL